MNQSTETEIRYLTQGMVTFEFLSRLSKAFPVAALVPMEMAQRLVEVQFQMGARELRMGLDSFSERLVQPAIAALVATMRDGTKPSDKFGFADLRDLDLRKISSMAFTAHDPDSGCSLLIHWSAPKNSWVLTVRFCVIPESQEEAA